MKFVLFTLAALAASSGLASADSLRSSSSSSADALAVADSASRAVSLSQGGAGGSVNINSPAHTIAEVRNSGTTTIRSAPQVVAPSMSSGHPCAFAPVSVGVSVVGFGGAFGGQRIDDACLLAQMGERPAAMVMIAARNPAACQALMAVGRIRSCGGRSATVAAAPVAAPAPPRYVNVNTLPKGTLYRKNGKLYRKS